MTRRLLFAHAHPDDEASKGAATAARYVDEGAEVVLVTFTGGEAGEVLNPSCDPVPPGRIREVRAAELAASVEAVGFTRAHQLGFVDSGYHEDPAMVPVGTFARIPLEESARAFAAVVRLERPHVVVTYPSDGGYPHPDHIATHMVTMRGLEIAEDPSAERGDGVADRPWRVAKVYASSVFPRERIEALHDALVEVGRNDAFLERLRERLRQERAFEPDARIHCASHFPRRDAALRAHVTQVDPHGPWFAVPRDLERERYPYEAYELLRSDVEVQRPETDLFAGLDVDAWDAADGRRAGDLTVRSSGPQGPAG